jgi:hypothetical protein
MVNKQIYFHLECNIPVRRLTFEDLSLFLSLAVVGPAIDTATGLQLQQATAYTTLPAQYPIYAPTAIYSHLPTTTTLIPGTLASPGKEG